jgi:hypothetical protein
LIACVVLETINVCATAQICKLSNTIIDVLKKTSPLQIPLQPDLKAIKVWRAQLEWFVLAVFNA